MTPPRLVAIVGLTISLLAVPLAAEAQPAGKLPRVGYLASFSGGTPTPTGTPRADFERNLRDLGWVNGQNVIIEFRFAEGRPERLPALAAEVLALKVDVVYAGDPYAIRAMATATRTVPIVGYDLETDPVEAGWVKSLAQPGGNVTGVFLDLPELAGKQVQLLVEAVPRLQRLAVLWDRTLAAALFRATEAAAQSAGLSLQSLGVTRSDEIDGAFEMAKAKHAEALIILTSPLFLPWSRVAELALRHRLPSIRGAGDFARAGGLMGYGPARTERGPRVASYVDRILRGAKPADLPVQRPAIFEFVVNQKTARALGLTIPPALLMRADQVIE